MKRRGCVGKEWVRVSTLHRTCRKFVKELSCKGLKIDMLIVVAREAEGGDERCKMGTGVRLYNTPSRLGGFVVLNVRM